MWLLSQITVGAIGLAGGVVVASGLAALMIGLGIIPRYAGITHTGDRVILYETCTMLGTIFGNLFYLYRWELPVGTIGLCIVGLLFGIFLGSWVIALGEVVNIFAIMARRIGLTKGVGLVIISIALGKILGSILFFFYGW